MTSCFTCIKEDEGQCWHTKPIPKSIGHRQRLTFASAVIATHFIDMCEWNFFVREGSLTFQHKQQDRNHDVIKLFLDEGNQLALKNGLSLPAEPIVVGIELTELEPYVRKSIREELRRDFLNVYLDPEKGYTKYYLSPINDHFYDMIFLLDNPCPYIPDPSILVQITDCIDAELDDTAQN